MENTVQIEYPIDSKFKIVFEYKIFILFDLSYKVIAFSMFSL